MKKIIISLLVVVASTSMLSAQNVGSYLANKASQAAKRALEKKVDNTVDNAMDTMANRALGKLGLNNFGKAKTDTTAAPKTAVEYMRMMPDMPAAVKVAEFKYYQEQPNPPLIKMAANPVTLYKTKTTSLYMQALESTTTIDEKRAQEFSQYSQKQLEEYYGITAEQASTMSEEELQALVYRKALESYSQPAVSSIPTSGPLADMMEEYTKIEDEISGYFDAADNASEAIWNERYASKGDNSRLAFYNEIAPLYIEALKKAQNTRIEKQYPAAERFDQQAAEEAKKNPENFSDMFQYENLVLISFFTDSQRALELWTPSR